MLIDEEQDTTTPMMNLFDKLEMDKGKTLVLIFQNPHMSNTLLKSIKISTMKLICTEI